MIPPSSATAGAQPVSQNISVEELIASRSALHGIEPEPSEEIAEDEPEHAEPEVESTTEDETYEDEPEAAEEPSDEPEIDLLDLSTEQIQELAKRGKSRLLQRVGELTAQKRILEEKLQTAAATTPAVKDIPQESNPFREIAEPAGLAAKARELEQILEDTDNLLDEHADYGPEDIIVVGQREFTKQEIRRANKNARDGLTKFLPAQQKHLARQHQLSAMGEHFSTQAKKEVPDIANADTNVGKQFAAMMADPIVDQVRNKIPELGAQMEYLLAHAARSIFGAGRNTPTGMGTKMKLIPTASPIASGAARSRPDVGKQAAEAYSRFEKSHSVDDWMAARIAKLQKI